MRRPALRPGVTLALVLALVLGACSGNAGTAPTRAGSSPLTGTTAPPATVQTMVPSIPPAGSTPAMPSASQSSMSPPIRIALSGAAPDAIVIDGQTAWVLAGEGGLLMEVDLAQQREIRATNVGFGATHLALPSPGVAAVGRFDDGGIDAFCVLVDLETREVRPVTTGELGGLTADDEGRIWALEKAGGLVRIDVATGQVAERTTVTVGQNVHTEIQWGAGSVWLGSDGLPVVRIDAADLTKRATIAVESGIPFRFRDGLIWGAGPTQLWAIDPATNTIARSVQLRRVAEILAMDIDGEDAWLAIRRPGAVGAVIRLDLATGAVIEEHAVSLPAAVRLQPDVAWVASYLTNELLGFQR